MIIKKKYTIINKNQKQEEPVIDAALEPSVELLEENKELDSNEINTEIQEEVPSQIDVEQEKKEEKKKKATSVDISLDDINFSPREERREGTRRRGYRRTQDRNIVSRAQKDAQSIKDAAKMEGYKEGINQAQKDIDELKSKFQDFYNYKDEMFDKVSECIMDISVEIARKILNKDIEMDRNSVLAVIKGVVNEINKTENKITLKVMPKDVELVRDKVPEIFSDKYFEAKISVIPDNNIQDGGVIVETSNGIVDATIDTQLAIIEKALRKQEEG